MEDPAAPSLVWRPVRFLELPAEPTRTGSNSRKRPSEGTKSDSKRQTSEPRTRHPAIVQAGSFVIHAARQHMIGLVVLDDLLYVWRYDRWGAIQCSALNSIQDLPRLLFAVQRFEDCRWGLHANINPAFGTRTPSYTMILPVRKGGEIDIDDGLIAKVSWAEETPRNEPGALKRVYEIANGNDDVNGHAPDMVCSTTYPLTSTSEIRKRLGLKQGGTRVLYPIIFWKLKPIIKLIGDEFLEAWLDTAKCHLALWKNDVHHRDVSPSYLMHRVVNGKIKGVLIDFDLASIRDGGTGTERSGTIPFMALEILDPNGGKFPHLYEYDAESFIWVLIWVVLRYDYGKLREENRPLDEWLKCNAFACYKEKCGFLFGALRFKLLPGAGHEQNSKVANECVSTLHRALASRSRPRVPALDPDAAFQQLIMGPLAEELAFLHQ